MAARQHQNQRGEAAKTTYSKEKRAKINRRNRHNGGKRKAGKSSVFNGIAATWRTARKHGARAGDMLLAAAATQTYQRAARSAARLSWQRQENSGGKHGVA